MSVRRLAALATLAACTLGGLPGQGGGPPVVAQTAPDDGRPLVAFLAPLSGPHADVGQRAWRSVLMAADLWDGARIEPYDTGEGAALAAQAAQLDGAVVVLGPVGELESRAVVEALGPEGPPVYLLSGVDGLENLGPRVFRLHSSLADQARMLAGVTLSERPGTTYAVAAPDDAAGREAATAFIETVVDEGGVVIGVHFWPVDDLQTLPLAERIVGQRTQRLSGAQDGWARPPSTRVAAERGDARRPDALFIAGFANDIADLLPSLRYLGWVSDDPDESVQLLGTSGWNGPELEYAGDSAAGAQVVVLHTRDDPRAAASNFTLEYETRFGESPTEFEAQVFDAAGYVLSAIAGLPPTATPVQVVRAVDSAPAFNGVCGEMMLSADGGVVRDMGLWEVDGAGRLDPIGVISPPDEAP